MNEEQLYNLILSYFPHRKNDEEFREGGYAYAMPYSFPSDIVQNIIAEKPTINQKDIDSLIHFVNDFYDEKMWIEQLELDKEEFVEDMAKILSIKNKNSTAYKNIELLFEKSVKNYLDGVIENALGLLYPEDELKPLFKFGPKALAILNSELKEDDRFNKVLFGW